MTFKFLGVAPPKPEATKEHNYCLIHPCDGCLTDASEHFRGALLEEAKRKEMNAKSWRCAGDKAKKAGHPNKANEFYAYALYDEEAARMLRVSAGDSK